MEKKLSLTCLSSFCLELSLMLKAGIPLSEGVYILSEDEKDTYLKQLLKDIYSKTDSGDTLYNTLKNTEAFPKYMVNMVRIGEETGKLEDVLRSLSDYYNRKQQLDNSIKSAVLYPSILLVLMLAVIIILLTNVLPVFNDIAEQLGIDLYIGRFLSNFGIIIVIILLISVFIAALLLFKNFDRSTLGQKIASARFASAMSMTISSGTDTDTALDMARELSDNSIVNAKIDKCKSISNSGESFVKAVEQAGIFNSTYSRMLAVGFRTGSVDTVMSEIAKRCAETVDNEIDSAVSKVEPAIVIIMSMMVGVILLSVMLPLMNIMNVIG